MIQSSQGQATGATRRQEGSRFQRVVAVAEAPAAPKTSRIIAAPRPPSRPRSAAVLALTVNRVALTIQQTYALVQPIVAPGLPEVRDGPATVIPRRRG